ncbi:MAG: hypothetical protein ACTJLK_04065 [Anaplasma sp.]
MRLLLSIETIELARLTMKIPLAIIPGENTMTSGISAHEAIELEYITANVVHVTTVTTCAIAAITAVLYLSIRAYGHGRRGHHDRTT